MLSVTILGVSGSIGSSALQFLRLHRDTFTLKNIALRNDWRSALDIRAEFGCQAVGFEDSRAAEMFVRHAPNTRSRVLSGPEAASELASEPVDVVLAAISGSAGFPSVLAAIMAGNRIALANKESLVCGGAPLLELAASKGVPVIPVDSEHSAIFQCLLAGTRQEVVSLLLTASGGPFRTASIEQMRRATPEQALAHPNWRMGLKNTIDSATLANKGLELIEAAYLFGCDEGKIDVLINPTSVMHSAVCYRDGSMVAQLGRPDMRVAVGYGLSWPARLESGVEALSLSELGALAFETVDPDKFPSLGLARSALRAGGDGPLLFNAANEIAVKAFISGKLGLMRIPALIETCLERGAGRFTGGLPDVPVLCREALDFCRAELAGQS
jgi:1-deoxy-D-xylulose-5-phosphate reductoisomerase